jgi:hypothetical protein
MFVGLYLLALGAKRDRPQCRRWGPLSRVSVQMALFLVCSPGVSCCQHGYVRVCVWLHGMSCGFVLLCVQCDVIIVIITQINTIAHRRQQTAADSRGKVQPRSFPSVTFGCGGAERPAIPVLPLGSKFPGTSGHPSRFPPFHLPTLA